MSESVPQDQLRSRRDPTPNKRHRKIIPGTPRHHQNMITDTPRRHRKIITGAPRRQQEMIPNTPRKAHWWEIDADMLLDIVWTAGRMRITASADVEILLARRDDRGEYLIPEEDAKDMRLRNGFTLEGEAAEFYARIGRIVLLYKPPTVTRVTAQREMIKVRSVGSDSETVTDPETAPDRETVTDREIVIPESQSSIEGYTVASMLTKARGRDRTLA